MKALRYSLLPLALTAALATTASAIDAPEDNAPPPAPADAGAAPQPQAGGQAQAQVQAAAPAFLGVGGAPVPELLAVHLNLKPGEGVVVRTLMPDGPAAKAGITENDIIIRVAGQPVTSQEDLAIEVRKHQPGDEIAIDIIHQGKAAAKTATLVVRPDGLEMAPVDEIDRLRLQGLPDDLADRVREMMEQQRRLLGGAFGELGDDAEVPVPPVPPQGIHDAMERMRQQMGELRLNLGQDGGQGVKVLGTATFKMMEATVRDKQGKIVWSGPWETEQDKAAAPPDVRERLNRLNIDPHFQGQGLRLRLGGGLGMPFAEPDEPAADADEDAGQDAPEAPERGAKE
ncbi:MAG: PDZ domain-containing protein [Akkermansiaceae bacterium]|nr:PDZ domain-containing protein [Akkermansiaceae bacterium]